MSKIPSPHFQIEIWAIFYLISSLINFERVYVWPVPKFGQGIWFTILFFFHPKESYTLFEILTFLLFIKLWIFLSQSELLKIELPKCSHSTERCIRPLIFHSHFFISTPFFRNIQPPTTLTPTPIILTPPITEKYQIV